MNLRVEVDRRSWLVCSVFTVSYLSSFMFPSRNFIFSWEGSLAKDMKIKLIKLNQDMKNTSCKSEPKCWNLQGFFYRWNSCFPAISVSALLIFRFQKALLTKPWSCSTDYSCRQHPSIMETGPDRKEGTSSLITRDPGTRKTYSTLWVVQKSLSPLMAS